MQGFWTITFSGVQGLSFGVMVCLNGKVFGGDSALMYTGTYTEDGNNLNISMQVQPFAPGATDNFNVTLAGTIEYNTITATGEVPGTQLHLGVTMQKQASF